MKADGVLCPAKGESGGGSSKMLIGMSNYGKSPDPVLALARDAARTIPGPPMAGAHEVAGQPPRFFVKQGATWLLRPELRAKGLQPWVEPEPVFGGPLSAIF